MKRIGIIGLCLVAASALGAMSASVTQAAEIGTCLRVPKVRITYEGTKKAKIREGKYEERHCLTLAPEKTGKYPPYEGPEGSYEWYPSLTGIGHKPAKAKTFKYSTRTGEVKIDMPDVTIVVGGEPSTEVRLKCQTSTGEGEWTGPKSGVSSVTLKQCKLVENRHGATVAECSGELQPPGQIMSSSLTSTLLSTPEEVLQTPFNAENLAVEPYSSVIAVDEVLVNWTSAGTYIEFKCGAYAFRILGGFGGRIKTSPTEPRKENINTMRHRTNVSSEEGKAWFTGLATEYSEGGPYKTGGPAYEKAVTVIKEHGGYEIKKE